jgi:hypothetical protein
MKTIINFIFRIEIRRVFMSRLCAMLALVVFVSAVAGCDDKPSVFIALDSDFATFESWPSVMLGSEPLPGHPPGPRFGYLNRKAPKGAKQYPVGTVIVKAIEPPGALDTGWEIFAMAKRGGNFNPEGALNWEFFRLKIVDGAPHIVTRGLTAADPDDGGLGYFDQLGNDFVDMCNGCHGTKASVATDHVLSPLLQLGM